MGDKESDSLASEMEAIERQAVVDALGTGREARHRHLPLTRDPLSLLLLVGPDLLLVPMQASANKGTLAPGQNITVNQHTVQVERYLSQGTLTLG
jgi:hypothetical protein